jgi:hypothetical protein
VKKRLQSGETQKKANNKENYVQFQSTKEHTHRIAKKTKTLQIATKKRTNDHLVIKTLNPKPMLSNISFMVDATM